MQRTKIEYLTHSWSPIAMRCTPVSAGCDNCWHLVMAKRLSKNPMIDRNRQDAYKGGVPLLDEEKLYAPQHLKKPARIGTMFMGDLFHESLNWNMQLPVFHEIQSSPRHTFFILTKRPKNMKRFMDSLEDPENRDWPNVYFGVSVEDQKTYDERASILSRIECTHRFISFEPLLGPVIGEFFNWRCDWAIVGGETGPYARPSHPDWVRSIKDQCQAAGVPFFFKSWGTPRFSNIDISDWVSAGYDPTDKRDRNFLDGRKWKEIP